VVGAHVLAHALVVVDAAVRAGESRRAHALLLARVAVTVVAAVVRADFDFAGDASVANPAITAPLITRPMPATAIRTLADAAVWPRESRLAQARSVVAVAVDAFRAKLR
jgi:uncharacterized membrane protein